MLAGVLVALCFAVPRPSTSTGPPPDHHFWADIVSRAGLQPLATHRSLRLIRISEADFPATVVTVVPTRDGAHVDIRVLANWQRAGAVVSGRDLSQARYDALNGMARAGLWSKEATGPTGKPQFTDGVLWYLEGFRDGERYAIVRHEPNDPEVRTLCDEIMKIIGSPELGPQP